MNPVVSIVIPTYNRVNDLERALKSVFIQTYSEWEVVIVDNYSSDNTDEMIESLNDTRLRLYKIHNNGVIAASRNLGIDHAKGKYIAFLDSDDWWAPQKLEKSLKYLEQGADVVYHSLYMVTKARQKFIWRKVRSRVVSKPVFNDLMKYGNPLVNSSVVIKKSVLNEIGRLSEEEGLIAIEDFDAWLRVAKITDKFKFIPETLGYYWAGGGNVSNPERMIKNIQVFEMRYFSELQALDCNDRLWWINYSKGRSYYLLGNYPHAKNYFDRIKFRSSPIIIFIKTYWMSLFIKCTRS